MRFEEKDGALLAYHQGEMLRIESWGEDSLRVRATKLGGFTNEDWALTEPVPAGNAVVKIGEMDHRLSSGVVEKRPMAVITNGRIQAKVNFAGVITFYRDGTVFLQEYFRNYDGTISRESRCLKVINREWKGIIGGSESKLIVKFESNDGEKIVGMGQYQHSYMDLKGCTLELEQRNSQISVPFMVSSYGYGMLWNNPAGELYGVECPFYQADGLLADRCRYAQEDSGAIYRGDWTGSWFSRGPHGAVAV